MFVDERSTRETTMTIQSITSGQMKQYKRFVEDAADRALTQAGVGREGLQRLIESGGEFQVGLVTLITKFAMSDQFADEEVESNCGYGAGYKGPKPIAEQVLILRAAFPNLGSFDETLAAKPVPAVIMEGNFAIPHWSLIASTYGEAVEKVMAAIASKRKVYNYREGQLGSNQLRETSRKAQMLQTLREEQKGHGILVVAGQFGRLHAGQSVRRSRKVFTSKEFGFGAYEVAIMLLTHPERLTACENLWIDCAGDEYASKAGGVSSEYPYWYFDGNKLRFSSGGVGYPSEYYGSASGCLPECES